MELREIVERVIEDALYRSAGLIDGDCVFARETILAAIAEAGLVVVDLRDAKTAMLVALAEHGIPPDVQECLVRGDGRGRVAPGALDKMLIALAAASAAKP